MTAPTTKRSARSLVDRPELAANAEPTARLGPHDCLIELPSADSLRFDRLGRWQAARFEGVLFRRVLDGRVVRYPHQRAMPKDVDDAAAVHTRVTELAGTLRQRFAEAGEQLRLEGPRASRQALLDDLSLCEAWPADRMASEKRAFEQTYPEPVEILPPDRYRDVVVLPATGCPSGRCTFCRFYRDRPFRIVSEADFRDHLTRVAELFGPALPLRTGLFLGSASAMSLSQDRLLRALELTRQRFGPQQRGIAAFWDPDHAPSRTQAQWQALADAGLSAVYLGLETGLPTLRASVGKSADIDRIAEALQPPRAAVCAHSDRPVRLGVIVLVGVGGLQQTDAHLEATAAFIERLALSSGDMVFVSALLGSMDESRLLREQQRLKVALKQRTAARVVPYAMEQYRYYA